MQLAIYQKHEEECQKKLNQMAALCSRISFWRVTTFLAAGLFFYLGYRQKNIVFCLPGAAALVIFIILIQYHNKLEEEQRFLRNYQSVARDYILRFGDGWRNFTVNGERYLIDDFPEAKDLDIFGKNSLYQYICTASTVWGQDQLAVWLKKPGRDLNEMRRRQQAAAELAESHSFSLNFEAAARSLREKEYKESKKIMEDFFCTLEQSSKPSKVRKAVIWICPVITLSFLFAALFGISRQITMSCFIFAFWGQLLSAFAGTYWNQKVLAPVYKMYQAIIPYRKLLEYLQQESFDSLYLGTLKERLFQKPSALSGLKELESIADAVKTRHNLYASLFCNGLFLYDYHCVERYAEWKACYQSDIKVWLEAIGEIEALISLGVISHTREVHTLPQIQDMPRPYLSAEEIRHPLIKEPSAVGNDINMQHNTCIVTGSNMSGKTTFMRSIGVNLVLAYAGGFCTASNLCISVMKIYTSMRVEDNVNEGISTFYAELLRIKRMIEASGEGVPMISLIDEIYRGTNSQDRIYAAKETVRKLSHTYAFTLLTTHDFELCDLESDLKTDAENYHFAECYKDNKIYFDYKLKKGRCTTRNARYLLHMAGIL